MKQSTETNLICYFLKVFQGISRKIPRSSKSNKAREIRSVSCSAVGVCLAALKKRHIRVKVVITPTKFRGDTGRSLGDIIEVIATTDPWGNKRYLEYNEEMGTFKEWKASEIKKVQ